MPCKVVNHTRLSRRFLEFSDTSLPSPMSGRGLLLNSKQFPDFLVSLSPPKYTSSCTSDDVIKLLISKDSSGRTVVHSQLCPKVNCNCPKRLAAGTVDSLLGKRNADFNNIGRLHLTLKSTLNMFSRKRQARLLGSLSNSVFERRTSTGSGLFASLGSGSVETLG